MTPTRETIARAISGAPFPTGRSLGKADAVLRALDAAGLAVVPKEADAAMRDAGVGAALIDWHCVWAAESCETRFAADCIPDIYRAMIAAAPDVVG